MRRLGYLVVEGPHDIEFAIHLIRSKVQLNRVQRIDDLDEVMKQLVPNEFPHGGDLLRRVPVPTFLQNDSFSLAIHAAGGDSKISECVEDTLLIVGDNCFEAIGIILDSDSQHIPSNRYKNLIDRLKVLPLSFPAEAGTVLHDGKVRTGVYVLPDNENLGTLENIILECGDIIYPDQLSAARTFIEGILPHCGSKEFKDLLLPAGKNKALVSAVSSLLKPGKAVQVSIQDNSWFSGAAFNLERVGRVSTFLDQLFLGGAVR